MDYFFPFLDEIETALTENLPEHEKLNLRRYMFKICYSSSLRLEIERFKSKTEWFYLRKNDFKSFDIVGEKNWKGGTKGIWHHRSNGFLYKCSVEELCLKHETDNEDWEGLHAEGKIFNSLLGMLLWTIIYKEDIPDVFRNTYQELPYDWDTGK